MASQTVERFYSAVCGCVRTVMHGHPQTASHTVTFHGALYDDASCMNISTSTTAYNVPANLDIEPVYSSRTWELHRKVSYLHPRTQEYARLSHLVSKRLTDANTF